MKIQILDIALFDIQDGQQFYELQQEGLGAYFLDSLFSDIDALMIYMAAFTSNHLDIIARFQNDFPTQSTTG